MGTGVPLKRIATRVILLFLLVRRLSPIHKSFGFISWSTGLLYICFIRSASASQLARGPIRICALGSQQPNSNPTLTYSFLRKEVIQPHLPIRLPCYDFTPVISPAFSSFRFWITDFGHYQLPWCDGRCVQDPGTYSPQHADLRLLAIPASCSRVADCSPNWDVIFGVCLPSQARFPLLRHCSTCVAQTVRGMMI